LPIYENKVEERGKRDFCTTTISLNSVSVSCIKCEHGKFVEFYWEFKKKVSAMIASYCSFIQYEPHTDWPGIKLVSLKWKAGYLPHP